MLGLGLAICVGLGSILIKINSLTIANHEKTSYPQTETTKDSNCPNPNRQVHVYPNPNPKPKVTFFCILHDAQVRVSNLG